MMFTKKLAVNVARLLLVSLTLLVQSRTAPPASGTIAKNTLLQCSLMQPLDPATAKPGDDVPLRLTRPLVVGGITVLPVDTVAEGKVTKVTPSGKRCPKGEVKWELKEILLPDGSRLKTEVWATYRDPNVSVPATVRRDYSTGAIIYYAILDVALLPLLPAALVIGAGEALVTKLFRSGACRPRENPPLPANATVALRVRASREFRY